MTDYNANSDNPTFPSFRLVSVTRPQANIQEVRWVLNPTVYPLEDLAFEILRSYAPTGPWDVAGVVESGTFSWTDYTGGNASIIRTPHYVVRIASKSGKGYRDSIPVVLEHDPDHIALELVRKKNVYLTVRGGISVAVFTRKTWGAKCPLCWNKERMQATNPDCHGCMGTGFSGGYLNPILVPALFNPPKHQVIDTGIQYVPENVYVELTNYPPLHMNDVVVNARENQRYTVIQVAYFSHRMYTISQIALLNRVDENSIIYTLPVPAPVHAAEGRSWDLVERTRDIPSN